MSQMSLLNTSSASLPLNSYIYKIISTAPRSDPLTYSPTAQLAILSSDDSLRFLDATSLNLQLDGLIKNVNEKVTCLERANDTGSHLVVTAGRDGLIKFWDKRSKERVMQVECPHKLVSSLASNTSQNFLAAGIENPDDGPASCPVYIWDTRSLSSPRRTYPDSHTDTITSLSLHPSHPSLLLSSSTDSLLSVFDTSQADEDDALYQVINHRSAIAHAGFMFPSTDVYAIGTDETVSFYALQSQNEDQEEPKPNVCGDVREILGCEYVVGMEVGVGEARVVVGMHSKKKLEMIPVTPGSGALEYSFDIKRRVQFPGAHGEELVRGVFADSHSGTTFTCGEDGMIRAWRADRDEEMDMDDEAEPVSKEKKSKDKREKKKEKKEKRKESEKDKARYKPY